MRAVVWTAVGAVAVTFALVVGAVVQDDGTAVALAFVGGLLAVGLGSALVAAIED